MLDEVRSGCAHVADQAALVRVDHERLATYTATFSAEDLRDPLDDTAPGTPGPHDPAATEARVALVVTLDAINFGSGYHPAVRKRPGCSGAVTMATAWREHAATTPIDAEHLMRFSPDEAHRVFDQPRTDDCIELLDLFTAALNDLGQFVTESYGGSFTALIADAGRSADALVGILDRLPFFRDTAPYRGRTVPFYKRAQLTAADLAREFGGRGPGAFDDLDRLTAFADNLVPHVLRVDGVLRYDADLAASIDAERPVEAGSEAEVEIRAAGVHAVELLRTRLAEQGHTVRSSRLDELLWHRGGAPSYKAIPRHRTRSVFY